MPAIKPHAAVLVSPGMGHIIPALELTNLMATHHGFHVTVFVASGDDHAATSLVKSPKHQDLDLDLDLVFLPPVDTAAIVGPDASLTLRLVVIMQESLIPLRHHISAMKSPPMMLVVDIFGTKAFGIADEFGMLRYVFFTTSAWFLGFVVYSASAVEEVIEEHVKGHKPLKVPGCRSVRFEDTTEPFLDYPNNELFLQGSIQVGIDFSKADGILINTWENLESSTMKAFRDPKLLCRLIKAVYPVGPLVRNIGLRSSDHPVMDWLDRQRTESVLYVSFGSGGRLSADQMIELAWGLELSRQRFVWVVRPPSDSDASGSYFSVGQDSDNDPYYLPDGFINRTRDVGFVVPTWAPQVDILSHPSVAGFLSHCGWNSALESIMNGVPMITWPLYAEQKMNATFLAEEIGVAVRPKQWAGKDCVIGREEIEKMVRMIMVEEEGQGMRKKAKELKRTGEKASREGGSSHQSMAQVAIECLHILRAKSGGA